MLEVPKDRWWSIEFISRFQEHFQAAIRKPIVIALAYQVMLRLSKLIWVRYNQGGNTKIIFNSLIII